MSRHPAPQPPSHPGPSLDYLKSSPVRGQLEPHDPKTGKGWRYIQTTDTIDELKVLLPPGTASMYEQLLKFETYELSKKTALSWERILEIRHLKDRMIRKCQKLAKTNPPATKKMAHGDTFGFQTFIAPVDFRVKEMEKWFREQQKRATAIARRPSAPARTTAASTNAYCCARCAMEGRTGVHPTLHNTHHGAVPSSSKQTSQRPTAIPDSKQRPSILPKSHAAMQHSQRIQPQRSMSLPVRSARTAAPASNASIASPRPLPILLRGQREEYGLEPSSDERSELALVASPATTSELGEKAELQTSPPLDILDSRPELRRRRSCIKRASIGDIAKTVSWADAQEWDQQVAKYASAAREAQSSGKWEAVRALYVEQMSGLENLHSQVKEGLEHLRSETEHLLRVDKTVRRQRDALHNTFQDFEQKQVLLQEKVQEALQEAGDVLTRHGVGPKRELTAVEEV
ncbi:hypothetical protein BDQ12DRAFT_679064 [Crucibulum laeve]|uniref:Uncharacterized protein n=1 Tax=Crucibulum laeve TaxID=68775 RepID=A0A5C3M7D1_9AGAR|nr:hypothetical protein BDQ12DRAFT_679064 [Crucibulum laeve]